MAIRKLRVDDDPILRKKTREITEISDRYKALAQDMLDTMYQAEGVGLAGPQIGILRRICVIDVSEGGKEPIVMINPRITATKGTCVDSEGCLSFPGKSGYVERPAEVTCEYLNLEGEKCEVTGTGLLARAISHELDHLDGIVYVDKVIEDYEPEN